MTLDFRGLMLVVIAAVLPYTAQAGDEPNKGYTDDDIVKMLSDGGFRAVDKTEENVLKVHIDGLAYALYVYDDGDLQLYFGMTGYSVTPEDMNEWNRTSRLSRAYIDDVQDPVLEADLLANAGYTSQQLIEWVSVFDMSARDFRSYLNEHDRGD